MSVHDIRVRTIILEGKEVKSERNIIKSEFKFAHSEKEEHEISLSLELQRNLLKNIKYETKFKIKF